MIARLSTALSLNIVSTISNAISSSYLDSNPLDLSTGEVNTLGSPQVLLVGYRAAGWACTGLIAVSLALCWRLRGMGIVGQKESEPVQGGEGEDIELRRVSVPGLSSRRRTEVE